jgi:hypothetical protein
MDAISAIETITKPIHAAVTRNMVMAPPWEVSGVVNVMPEYSQFHRLSGG